jgi:hypothetical protein
MRFGYKKKNNFTSQSNGFQDQEKPSLNRNPFFTLVPQHPPPPTRLWKMVLPDVLHCRFVHRHVRTILNTYSKSSFPDGFNDNISSMGLFRTETQK